MGRGRAKAKQTKVARQLKYNSGGFDPNRLANELVGSSDTQDQPVSSNGNGADDDSEPDNPYAQYAEKYNDEGDEDESGDRRRRA